MFVIATNTAHHPMSPRVEQPGRVRSSAAGRLAQAAVQSFPKVPQRSWVTEFNNRAELPLAGTCGQRQPVQQRNTHTFVDYDDALGEAVPIAATIRKTVTDGPAALTVWVANDIWDSRRVSCVECVSQEMVDAVANQFLLPNERNDIYGLVTAVFDPPWGSHDRPCLIPDQMSVDLHILLYDIDGDPRRRHPRPAAHARLLRGQGQLPADRLRSDHGQLQRAPAAVPRCAAAGAGGQSRGLEDYRLLAAARSSPPWRMSCST